MGPSHGAQDGGSLTATFPFSSLSPFGQLPIFGVRLKITADKYSYLPILKSCLFCCAITLAMSEELAQEDEDAGDYDLETIQRRAGDDEITLVDNHTGPVSLGESHVVFEIGDEDAGSDDEADPAVKRRRGDDRKSTEAHEGSTDERRGLMEERNRND